MIAETGARCHDGRMPAHVERAELPGIGVRHDINTAAGRRLSVINFRDGGRELAIADEDDPDRADETVALTDEEATALSEVLGGSLILTQLAGLREQVAGLYTEQIPVRADSPVRRPAARRHEGPHPHPLLDRRDRARRTACSRRPSPADVLERRRLARSWSARARDSTSSSASSTGADPMDDGALVLIEIGALLLGHRPARAARGTPRASRRSR